MAHHISVSINGKEYRLENPHQTGAEIKTLAHIPLEDTLILDHHGKEKIIANDETVTLHDGADLHSRPAQKIHIHINRKPYVLDHAKWTGEQLKELATIPLGDTLFLQQPGKDDDVIANGKTIHVRDGEHFFSQPPADYGHSALTTEDVGAGLEFESLAQSDGWQFLIIANYPLPPAYTPQTTRLLVKLPPTFPDAAPDMFWVQPELRTAAGGVPAGAGNEVVLGSAWQRFSWHLKPGAWQPGISTLRDFMRCIRARFERGN